MSHKCLERGDTAVIKIWLSLSSAIDECCMGIPVNAHLLNRAQFMVTANSTHSYCDAAAHWPNAVAALCDNKSAGRCAHWSRSMQTMRIHNSI